MKTWLLNPRLVLRRPPSNSGQAPGVVVVEVDCPCGCLRPWMLPPVPGSFEPPTTVQELTQLQWRQLLNGCTYTGDMHRVVDSVTTPCGWIGVVRNGRVFDLTDRETDDKFGTRVAETLTKIAERRGTANGGIRGR